MRLCPPPPPEARPALRWSHFSHLCRPGRGGSLWGEQQHQPTQRSASSLSLISPRAEAWMGRGSTNQTAGEVYFFSAPPPAPSRCGCLPSLEAVGGASPLPAPGGFTWAGGR